MRSTRSLYLVVTIVLLATGCRNAKASVGSIYVAQSAAGAANGSSCANADAVAFANTPGNWGSGAGQIGPGTTVHLCGVITTGLQINGSGASGNVVTFLWEVGARISQPVAQAINLNGAHAYLVFDGGVPCSPGTACDTIEAANLTTYASGQTGIIEATANGSALANQNASSDAFYGCNGCHDIEIRNLIIRNLYQHTSLSDTTNNIDAFVDAFACPANNSGCAAGTISIHDSTIHDTGNAVQFGIMSSTTANIYKNDFYRNNWAVANSGTGTRTVSIHDNHFHDTSNWDTTADAFHHNGLHNFMSNASDSLGLYFYNNLSDGNWGTCCTTATGIFTEISSPNNFYVFNNVAVQYPTGTAPAWEYSATNGYFLNNTAIGNGATPNNTDPISVSGTGLTIENNVIQGYAQYLVTAPGTTFAVIDYNTYGTVQVGGVSPWSYNGTSANTFAAWKTACSCDSHGQQNNTLLLNTNGLPQSGSPVIGAATNLTSLAIVFLDSDTSAGNIRVPVVRPATGAWAGGAYQPPASLLPSPPASLTATPH